MLYIIHINTLRRCSSPPSPPGGFKGIFLTPDHHTLLLENIPIIYMNGISAWGKILAIAAPFGGSMLWK